jgi:hypothetical protein
MNTPQNDGGPITASMMTTEGPMDAIGGLSIRDWFAGMALQGIMLRPRPLVRNLDGLSIDTPELVSEYCYVQADAMLLARLNKPEALRAGE